MEPWTDDEGYRARPRGQSLLRNGNRPEQWRTAFARLRRPPAVAASASERGWKAIGGSFSIPQLIGTLQRPRRTGPPSLSHYRNRRSRNDGSCLILTRGQKKEPTDNAPSQCS